MIENFKLIHEDDNLLYFDGIATQKDKTKSVEYSENYFEKYVKYEGTPIAVALNNSRVTITEKYCKNTLLDIGIGSGEFIKLSNIKVYGFDINPYGVEWLKSKGLFVNPYEETVNVEGWTFWDSLEHFPEPQDILTKILPTQYTFISIPIFDNILTIKQSKHYRENEHYYYFTASGLISYMEKSGFTFIEQLDSEIKAGRKDILTFVFLKNFK
jgi:hypothetical protein